MSVFGAIFEGSSCIGKLRDLLGHFDKKDAVDFNKYHFLLYNSITLYMHMTVVLFLSEPCDTLPVRIYRNNL